MNKRKYIRIPLLLLLLIVVCGGAFYLTYFKQHSDAVYFQQEDSEQIPLFDDQQESPVLDNSESKLVVVDQQRIPVLAYHHLLREEEMQAHQVGRGGILTVKAFEEQMQYLYDQGFTTLTMEELEAFIDGDLLVSPKSVVITFDDGYKSNYLYAYPILEKYGFKATAFVISGEMTSEEITFNPYLLQYLSWSEKEAMESSGIFTVQCHTYNMHKKSGEKSYLLVKSEEEIREDLRKSRDTLKSSPYFAYPYGEYDQCLIDIVKEEGYRLAVTVETGYTEVGTNKYKVPRFGIYAYTTMDLFIQIVNQEL